MSRPAKACLLLALGLLLHARPAVAAGPAPVPTRPAARAEVPSLILRVAKGWGRFEAIETSSRQGGDWSPNSVEAAGVLGFLDGVGSVGWGAWRVKLDASGRRLRRSLASGNGRLFSLGVGRDDSGWSLRAAVGLREGRFLRQSVGLAYALRY